MGNKAGQSGPKHFILNIFKNHVTIYHAIIVWRAINAFELVCWQQVCNNRQIPVLLQTQLIIFS